jgi:tRNA pseudouridine55 synthase
VKNNINGWLNLHKPLHITSARAVAIVKRHLCPLKIGHAGTLDPLASGVLPLALGEATKTMQFCMDTTKEYEFTVKWGEATTTDDMEGEVIATSIIRPTTAEIQAILPQFTGVISQAPPQYSAIKINGRRAYDLARQNVPITIQERQVNIFKLEYDASGIFRTSCGKGTYIRSLARDIAVALGTRAHVTSLVRTMVGKFSLKNAILLEDIEKEVYKIDPSWVLLPVDTVLDDIQVLQFTPHEATRIRNGQKILFREISSISCLEQNSAVANFSPQSVFIAKCNNVSVAICKFGEGIISPIRVFNL